MRKPRHVTLAGWIFVALLALGVYGWIVGARRGVDRRDFAAGVGYTLALTGFFVMWAGGTARARGRITGAKELARELRDTGALRALAAAAGPAFHFGEGGPHLPSVARECDSCHRPMGFLVCVEHATTLCWPCLLMHDEPCVCTYYPIVRATNEMRAAARVRAKG